MLEIFIKRYATLSREKWEAILVKTISRLLLYFHDLLKFEHDQMQSAVLPQRPHMATKLQEFMQLCEMFVWLFNLNNSATVVFDMVLM